MNNAEDAEEQSSAEMIRIREKSGRGTTQSRVFLC